MKLPSKKIVMFIAFCGLVMAVAIVTVFIHDYFSDERIFFTANEAHGGSAGHDKSSTTLRPMQTKNIPSEVDLNSPHFLDSYVISILDDPKLSPDQKFALLWDGYLNNKYSKELGAYYLDSLSGLTPLPHVDKILAELNSAMTPAGLKTHLMAVLQSAYMDGKNGMNEMNREIVLNAIKHHLYDADPVVAKEAVLLYSRMGKADDTTALLTDAYQRQLITEADFIRESAFKLPDIRNPQQQNAMLDTLLNVSKNASSDDTHHTLVAALGIILQNPATLEKIQSSTKEALAGYLALHEPEFHANQSSFDFIQAVEYCNWLQSVVAVSNKDGRGNAEFILDKIIAPDIDTHKIVAVLTSPEGQGIIRLARQNGKTGILQMRLATYVPQLSPDTVAYSAYQAALSVLQ